MQRRTVRFEEPIVERVTSNPAITVERLTNELRNCYDTVDEGRQLLAQLYDKLRHRKYVLNAEDRRNEEDCYLLSREVDNLKHILKKIAAKREDYIRQLTGAQDIIWNDRKQMENFLRSSRKVERRFQEKVNFLDRFSREPETLVSELKENSKLLSELLARLQDQLLAEERYIRNHVEETSTRGHISEAGFSVSPRDRRSYIYSKRIDDQALQSASFGNESSDGNSPHNVCSRRNFPTSKTTGLESRRDWRTTGAGFNAHTTADGAARNPVTVKSESLYRHESVTGDGQDRDFDSAYQRYKRKKAQENQVSVETGLAQPSSMAYGDDGHDFCDTSSLSKRLRQLVKQSENVQKLIVNASGKNTEISSNGVDGGIGHDYGTDMSNVKDGISIGGTDSCTMHGRKWDTERQSSFEYDSPNRLAAYPERRNMRLTTARCDVDENGIQEASAAEVREILQNLEKLDKAERASPSKCVVRHGTAQYNLTDHDQVRKELLRCLDKIFAMEKSCGAAEEEIKRLKVDLKHAIREKEMVERILKTEVGELKERLRIRTQDVEGLTRELNNVKRELLEVNREKIVNERSVENIEVNMAEKDLTLLKEQNEGMKQRVELKSKEVDELKKELENAIAEMEKLRQHKCGDGPSDKIEQYKSEIIILKEENEKLRATNEESIAEELAALQTAITDAEEKQNRLAADNNKLLKENEDWRRVLEEYSKGMSMKGVTSEAEEREIIEEKIRSSTAKLQEKIEELELAMVAKDAEIESLAENKVRRLEEYQMNEFMNREEQYQLELNAKEKQCQKLKERLINYEGLLANEGDEIGRRLDDMYENFVKSIGESNREKEELEEQLINLKEEHETLLEEYINKLNESEDQRKPSGNIPQFKDRRKQEIFEAFLKSNKSSKELAELLNGDFVDATPIVETGRNEKEIEKENEELYKKLVELDNEVLRRHKEVEKLKKQNKGLRDELEYVKSEQYIKNKVNQDIVNEKTKAYESLLKAKETEFDSLKEELKKLQKESKERESLSERIDQIYDKFMVSDEEEGGRKLAEGQRKYEELEEELSKRNREINILRQSNKRLKDMLLSEGNVEDEHLKKLLFWEDPSVVDAEDYTNRDSDDDLKLEQENLELLRRIKDLNEKLLRLTGVEDDYKTQNKKLRDKEKRCQTLEDENLTLRERLRSLQNEIRELSSVTRTRKSGRSTSDDLIKENEQLQERVLLMGLDNERLSDDINELKARLHKSEYEATDLDEQLKTVNSSGEKMHKIQEENLEMEEKLKELRKKISMVEKERKDLNEEYVKQKIKNEEDAKMFSNEIQKLKGEVVSLLGSRKQPLQDLDTSHDSLPGDEFDGGMHKFDRNKLIKKLQMENHQLAARIISLESETTATTKIVADMERGHGHLTGILRSHLILQKETTAKLLDNSLKQYSEEFEKVQTKFKGIEDKYDKEKKYSSRRNFAWELFANAMATITNINAILEEGLIKVDDDLERDFSSDEDFEAKDYKSRLWILRRRLSDVEKRHRELLLRSEELSIRLDAKTTEYDVTQDELEDTIRTLETKEMALGKLKQELSDCLEENARLKNILAQLKENQQQTIGAVIAENEMLKKDIETSLKERSVQSEQEVEEMRKMLAVAEKSRKEEVNELREKLLNSEKKREEEVMERKKKIEEEHAKNEEELKKLRSKLAEAEKDFDISKRRIAELEDLLKKMEASNAILEKYLQKARSGCKSDGIDHHGTIHMLRDDLKKLFKENEELKKELDNRQKKITSLAGDLRKAKIAVKEQIGTERSLDEQILDRATKDQIMALKRRIKVLEMEKERLVKGANIREAYQKGSDEQTSGKRESKSKAGSKKKESLSTSKSDAKSSSEKVDGQAGADDTEEDIDANILSEDISSGGNEDIELRDKLIQELELRVRELKHELSMKGQQRADLPVSDNAENKPAGADDLQNLREENDRLKAQLKSFEESLSSDDAAKRSAVFDATGYTDKPERKKLDFEDHLSRESKIPKRAAFKREEAFETQISATSVSNAEAGVGFPSLDEPTTPGSANENLGGRAPQFINFDIEIKEESVSSPSSDAQQGRGLSRIPISPRRKHTSKTDAETDDKRSQEDLRKKIREQEEDIETLLQSVEYFEKENENLKAKADKSDKLQEKLQNSEKEIKTLNTRSSKLRDQLKDSKLHDEKLKDLEDKMKKLITENKNLEQQIKKTKAQHVEEGKKIAKERELAKGKTKEMQEHLERLKEEMKERENVMDVLTAELNIDEFPADEIALRNVLVSSIDKKVAEKQETTDLKGLIEESSNLRQKLAQEESDNMILIEEIEELRKELEVALANGRGDKERFEKSEVKLNVLEDEIKKLKSRNAVLEVTQDVLRSLGSHLQDEELKSQLDTLDTEMDAVKARNVVLEVIHEAIGNVGDRLHEKRADEDFKTLEAEIAGLQARNFVLELTHEVISDLNARLRDEAVSSGAKSNDNSKEQLLNVGSAWERLKKKLINLELVDKEGSPVGNKKLGEWDESFVDLSTVVGEMQGVYDQLQLQSQESEGNLRKLGSLERELGNQRTVNLELERKINDFKDVIQETNAKVKELEEEKENGDEIGHQLVRDQISSLKEKIGKQDAEKVFLEELVDRHERNIDRLSEQVRILEKQLNERELEISQLTQRALESEEDLEIVKSRNEELEDDYQRLLQYGMQPDAGLMKSNDDDENEQLLIKMGETIQKLEQEKAELQSKIEDASFTSLIQESPRMTDYMSPTKASQDFEKQIERSDEFEKMQDTVKRLELENEELQERIQEIEATGGKDSRDQERSEQIRQKDEQLEKMQEMIYKLELDKEELENRVQELLQADSGIRSNDREASERNEEIARMEKTIYKLELDKADLENRVQELLEAEDTVGDTVGRTKEDADKSEEISRMEETIYRLQLDNSELEQKVKDLISDDRDATQMLRENLLTSEEKIDQLENELRQLSIQHRNLQESIDDVLASPRSASSDEEVLADDDNEIFQGGPRSWKRRLVVSYRELREKSIEIATLRMILAAKNMGDTAKSGGDSSKGNIDDDRTKDSVYLLQEEVRMKTIEIAELREEISKLQNSLQMKSDVDSGGISVKINGVEGNKIENEELRKEVEDLKISLREKEENYETLCDQLFGAENVANSVAMEGMKQEIVELKQDVSEKQFKCEELESNNELLYNELIKAKASSDSHVFNEASGSTEAVQRLEQTVKEQGERYKVLTQDYEELEDKYRKEMNYASTRIGELMVQVGQLETQLSTVKHEMLQSKEHSGADVFRNESDEMLARKLERTEDELQRKNGLIANLKETLASFYDSSESVSDSLAKELKRLANENKNLQEQLDLQKQKYELELDSMKTLMSAVKGEHVHSLKDDFERVCKDKIQLQVKLSEVEEKCTKQSAEINELMVKNNELSNKLKENNDNFMLGDTEGVVNLADISL